MIASKYALAILNALFHTGGSTGLTPQEEMEELISLGVPATGRTPSEYMWYFSLNGYEEDESYMESSQKEKNLVNESTWYYTKNISETFKYTKDDREYSVVCPGWTINKKTEQTVSYPKESFLALFTKLPEPDGTGYEEPGYKEPEEGSGEESGEESACTYMRVNLHSGIITGDICLNRATNNDEGGTKLTNNTIIMYPEVSGVDWGEIVGFGVFDTETTGSGSPILWGPLSNSTGSVYAETEHVPLFRIGDFEVTLL